MAQTILLILAVLVLVTFLMMGVRVVRQGYVYTIERLGKFTMPAEPGLTATADGRRVVFAQVDRVESDLMLVEPFE